MVPEQQHPRQVPDNTGPKRHVMCFGAEPLCNTTRTTAPRYRNPPQALEKDLTGVLRRISTMEKEAGGDAAELEAQLQAITKQVGGAGEAGWADQPVTVVVQVVGKRWEPRFSRGSSKANAREQAKTRGVTPLNANGSPWPSSHMGLVPAPSAPHRPKPCCMFHYAHRAH